MEKNLMTNRIKEYLIKRNIDRFLGIKDYRISFLAQGEYNINYLINDEYKKFVFRINTGSQINVKNQIEYEFNALKRLESSKVTPKPFYVDGSYEDFEYGILIMEFLEGRPLDYKTDLLKAAEIFGKIHNILPSVNDYETFIVEEKIFTARIKEANNLLNEFWDSTLVPSELKNFFDKFINTLIKNSYKENYFLDNKWFRINNTEVNSHNFIIGEKFYLIDWEKPVLSDPCQDITQFLAPTTTLWKSNYILTEEEKEGFYKYYENYVGKDKNIRERVKIYSPYLLLRALSWCAYAYIEYNKPEKEIKNEDTYKKINEYLQIDFLKNITRELF
ncbi:Phosphotransferase enzyme family protein [Caloramator mitchellensis]|uniref:Phosphotransferase enzyme family protein n=1 Tax=Caloramator mitchellensis TaxID=908809 RepID=A0A0R3JXG9_CALMK|nr:phosphotransferase [Caloramator mitchellensis]KRQ85796.1 Phosphotransferase enzyme family protein [Caloramator mitchellensis]